MSVASIHVSLIAAVARDRMLKVVDDAPVPVGLQKLPCAQVWFDGDQGRVDIPTAGGTTYRFGVRLFVRFTDPSRAQAALIERLDAFKANMEAHRALTAAEETVTVYGGSVDSFTGDNGAECLTYTATVTVEPRPAYQVALAVGTDVVALKDVDRASVPIRVLPQSVVSDITGAPLIITQTNMLESVALAGRLDSSAEVALLITWYEAWSIVAYTDRHGVTTTGWTIAGTPFPRAEARAVGGEVYDTAFTLWRMP